MHWTSRQNRCQDADMAWMRRIVQESGRPLWYLLTRWDHEGDKWRRMLARTAAAAADGIDIRAVSGDRVNVRDGPGTNYSVVNQLVRGDKVEVLQDAGDGWVKLRPVDGGPVGWIASFLLTEG